MKKIYEDDEIPEPKQNLILYLLRMIGAEFTYQKVMRNYYLEDIDDYYFIHPKKNNLPCCKQSFLFVRKNRSSTSSNSLYRPGATFR